MSTNDNKNENRKRFTEDKEAKFAICEESWFASQPKELQERLKEYGRYCVIVPDFFFDWTDFKKYKDNLTPNAEMWMDEYGSTYVVDAVHGKGHMLRRVGEDTKLGTTADYWFADDDDVQLAAAIDRFAALIGKQMIPIRDIKRFNPPVQSDVLLKYIKGVIRDSKTDNINKIFNVATNKMTSYVRYILELKSKKAGYRPDDFLKCCIRWQLLWNRIPDSDESLLEVLQDA